MSEAFHQTPTGVRHLDTSENFMAISPLKRTRPPMPMGLPPLPPTAQRNSRAVQRMALGRPSLPLKALSGMHRLHSTADNSDYVDIDLISGPVRNLQKILPEKAIQQLCEPSVQELLATDCIEKTKSTIEMPRIDVAEVDMQLLQELIVKHRVQLDRRPKYTEAGKPEETAELPNIIAEPKNQSTPIAPSTKGTVRRELINGNGASTIGKVALWFEGTPVAILNGSKIFHRHPTAKPILDSDYWLLNGDIETFDQISVAMPVSAGNVKAHSRRLSLNSNPPLTKRPRISSVIGECHSSAQSGLCSSLLGSETSISFESAGNRHVKGRHITEEASMSNQTRCILLQSGDLTHLDRVAMELLNTERCYINDLIDIKFDYLNFLLAWRDILELTLEEVIAPFGSFEKILKFHRKLYQALDAAQLRPSLMAKCFIDYSDGFACYSQYCAQYPKMAAALEHLLKKPHFARLLTDRQRMLGHALPLSSYLHKPVQRLLKYHLFLENALKCSMEASNVMGKEVAVIKMALECMTSRTKEINEAKKREEYAIRATKLSILIQRQNNADQTSACEDLSQYGDLILEGSFKLLSTKTYRQLFLFEEMLLIAKEKSDKTLCCKDCIPCPSLQLNESVPGEPFAFQLHAVDKPRTRCTLLACSLEQKRQWARELKRMMLSHSNVVFSEHAKNLDFSKDTSKSIILRRNSVSSISTSPTSARKKVINFFRGRSASVSRFDEAVG